MKLYILLPMSLMDDAGKIAAQAAHTAARAENAYPGVCTLPVVCLYYNTEQQLASVIDWWVTITGSLEKSVTWSEPDYEFPCICMGFIAHPDMEYFNQGLGKLKLVY